MTGFALNTHTLSMGMGEAHLYTWGNEDTTPNTKNRLSIIPPLNNDQTPLNLKETPLSVSICNT